MAIVYRFQNERGLGPWSGSATGLYNDAQRTRYKYHSCGDMPSPMGECCTTDLHKHYKTKGLYGMLFGFASLRQLKLSFPSSVGRAAMAKAGQELVVIEVPDGQILHGNRQCVFNKDAAQIVKRLDLKTLKEI